MLIELVQSEITAFQTVPCDLPKVDGWTQFLVWLDSGANGFAVVFIFYIFLVAVVICVSSKPEPPKDDVWRVYEIHGSSNPRAQKPILAVDVDTLKVNGASWLKFLGIYDESRECRVTIALIPVEPGMSVSAEHVKV